ncbi:MAG TPA: hypothetical protein VKA53_02155 [Thermoanaerobaculia bacterium]|nr:hypothetical protein [Thermoanaerobaculia bacterium]
MTEQDKNQDAPEVEKTDIEDLDAKKDAEVSGGGGSTKGKNCTSTYTGACQSYTTGCSGTA